MVRRSRNAKLNTNMYRHFAVITVCLTAALAMFADGESRDAVADELAAREQKAKLEKAEVEKFGKAKLVSAPAKPSAGFDTTGSGDFGAPMDDPGGGGFDPGFAPRRNTTSQVGATVDYAALGLPKEQFDQLDPSEQEMLMREFRELRARQTRSLLEGSAARGGGALEL